MAKKSAQVVRYRGYSSPNYTPVPDELFDEQLPDLSGAELKVLLYIIRRTFGFKKDSDNISLSQLLNGITTKEGSVLDRGTGLSKKTLLETIKSLVEKNLIVTERRRSEEKGDEPTTYRLHIIGITNETNDPTRGVKSIPGGVEKNTPRPSDKKYTTQYTVKQETVLQHRNSNSKILINRSKQNTGYQSFQAVGDLLKEKLEVEKQQTLPEPIRVAIDEVSLEFGEGKNRKANETQTLRIFINSRKNENSFASFIYEARSITKQQESVRKKMPYFFKVLQDLSSGFNALSQRSPQNG